MRTLVVLTTVCACLVAFAVSYGRNVLWAVTHFGSPSHVAFVRTKLSSELTGPNFVRCDFAGLSLELPLGIALNPKINSSGATRFLEFSEGDRQIRIVLCSNSANRAIFGTLPQPIDAETTAELLHRIYTADTRDFSLNMPGEQLLVHEWAMNYRNLFAYANHFDQIAFDERDLLHVLTLSSDPRSRQQSSRMKRLIAWSAQDGTDGGLIYILDNETVTGDWGDRIAASVKMRHDSPFSNFDFATATDSQILAAVKITTNADEPSVERKSPSQSNLLTN